MTVAQLRVAVKAKQPNLAVSRLNKNQLLDFYEGKKKMNPVIPKSGPALVKSLTAKSKAAMASGKKAPPKAPKIPAPLKAPPVPPLPSYIKSLRSIGAAKKASTKMATAGGGSAPAPAPAPAPKKPSKSSSSKKVIKTGGANISKGKLARLLTDFSAKDGLMLKPYSDRDVKQTYEEEQKDRDESGEEMPEFEDVKENLDRYLERYGKTDGGWGEPKPQSSVRASLALIGYELLYAPEYQTYEFVRLRKQLGIEKK
tara:strand:+ start:35 stop:802 length:768 start_codon:yes stop_codon:yes gene_type:complete